MRCHKIDEEDTHDSNTEHTSQCNNTACHHEVEVEEDHEEEEEDEEDEDHEEEEEDEEEDEEDEDHEDEEGSSSSDEEPFRADSDFRWKTLGDLVDSHNRLSQAFLQMIQKRK
jgi:hypothetical protein